jgi:ABC-type multidrug transport system ATPase subunit
VKIEIRDLSKSFGDKLVFKNLDYTFVSDKLYGISGSNGSGKSTLLKLLSGFTTPTSGSIYYSLQDKKIDRERIFEYISFIAPYIEVPTQFNFSELLDFHFNFRRAYRNISTTEIETIFKFPKDRLISKYSSGMIQRVKLALAFFSDSKILLLDEPTETLDEQGYHLYVDLLKSYADDRIVIISSNKERDFYNVNNIIAIEDYKR